MKIAIIGGGINGLCCAWVLSQQGHNVHLFEQDKLVSKTSQSSSKLLHGGLRYLEHGSFRLVREALRERDAWLERVPELTSHLRLLLPIYKHSKRKRWAVKIGLFLYDNLAGKSTLPKSKWLNKKDLEKRDPQFNSTGLLGAYEFSDGQMNDYKLGLWVAKQAMQAGCQIFENTCVKTVDQTGKIELEDGIVQEYDRLINITGPWATKLLEESNIRPAYHLDAIRGSHLVINRACKQAYLLEVPNESRIFFVLPWKGDTLLGTTEVKQSLEQPIECSEQERDYLLSAYNYYFTNKISPGNIVGRFAGVRPLLSSTKNMGATTREYAIHQSENLINIFGGKWTTALSLANKVAKKIH